MLNAILFQFEAEGRSVCEALSLHPVFQSQIKKLGEYCANGTPGSRVVLLMPSRNFGKSSTGAGLKIHDPRNSSSDQYSEVLTGPNLGQNNVARSVISPSIVSTASSANASSVASQYTLGYVRVGNYL